MVNLRVKDVIYSEPRFGSPELQPIFESYFKQKFFSVSKLKKLPVFIYLCVYL